MVTRSNEHESVRQTRVSRPHSWPLSPGRSLLNELYGRKWSQYQNDFRPTFKLEKREKKGTPYQRLLASEAIAEPTKARLREEHPGLDPFALKKSI